jgi:hypothetical protein
MRTRPVIGKVYWIWWSDTDITPDLGEVIDYASDKRARMRELTSPTTLNVPYNHIYEKLPHKLTPYEMERVVKNLFDPKSRFKGRR